MLVLISCLLFPLSLVFLPGFAGDFSPLVCVVGPRKKQTSCEFVVCAYASSRHRTIERGTCTAVYAESHRFFYTSVESTVGFSISGLCSLAIVCCSNMPIRYDLVSAFKKLLQAVWSSPTAFAPGSPRAASILLASCALRQVNQFFWYLCAAPRC